MVTNRGLELYLALDQKHLWNIRTKKSSFCWDPDG